MDTLQRICLYGFRFLVPLSLVAMSPVRSQESYLWKPLRIGAGGFITGLDVSPNGATKIIRADTYGAYVWNTSAAQWDQLVTASSMPAEDVKPDRGSGVYEIRVAPTNPDRLYMMYRGYVYRSNDRGSHWIRTSFSRVIDNCNDNFRTNGQKMAVDPANADVVYAGTPDSGIRVSADGGSAWSAVAAVPVCVPQNGEYPGHCGLAFDAASGAAGGRTRTVYLTSWGNGVWRSTDAGASFARIAGGTLGGPLKVKHAAVSPDGIYYATAEEAQGSRPNGVWKFAANAWTALAPGDQYIHSIAVDPAGAAHIIAGTDGGTINQSWDRGATWSGYYWDGHPGPVGRVAADIPWLAWTNEKYLSNGDMAMDPVTHEMLFAEGIGVWKAVLPSAYTGGFMWTSQSKGIEQLCPNVVTAPPGGRPVLGSWDRALFYVDNPDVFPSSHGVDQSHSIVMGWAVDYASTDPAFLAALVDWWGVEQSCYSTDRGKKWTVFPSFPAWASDNLPIGGSIAASTPDNIVWVPSNRKPPYYTKNRGQTWQKIGIPGIADDTDGWSWAYYLNRHMVAADRVTAGTFYLYHAGTGLYRSTNGGTDWSLVFSGEIAPFSGYNAKLKSVPGKAGHLFFTSGDLSGDEPSGPFMRSTNGGANWTALPGVLEVKVFGFGKEAPGSTYPALLIAGWVGKTWGIWRSDDEGGNWVKIGDWPTGSLAMPVALDGDKEVYGTVYAGLAGDGYVYGRIANASTGPTLPSRGRLDFSVRYSSSGHAGRITLRVPSVTPGRSGPISVSVLSCSGRLVDRLCRSPSSPGEYTTSWSTARLPAGVYCAKLVGAGLGAKQAMVVTEQR